MGNDDRCVCGPASSDWISPGSCKPCGDHGAACSKCINSEGRCQACNPSPFKDDDRCVCGPASWDWIHPSECKSCGEDVKPKEAEAVQAACSWASKCINSEGKCQACSASPFKNDDRCVCGPASSDWISPGSCKPCGDHGAACSKYQFRREMPGVQSEPF